VIGAGVAGLQAIATARRLGAVVSATDVRPAAKEEVESLGAKFVGAPVEDAATQGGYAKELAEAQQQRQRELLAETLKSQDLVITTAQIPGKPAPVLITRAMVADMKAGAVIVDLAAETGGNCELTRAGETVNSGGVQVIGAVNLAATIPLHASQMYSKNLETLLKHLVTDGKVNLDPQDEITGAMIVR
jgi:NAD(P) transhydrogenase subunit alpha